MPGIDVTVYNEYELDQDEFEEVCSDLFDRIVNDTPVETGTCASGWDLLLKRDEASIINTVEYTSYLEEGHSKQAPNGMVERNCDRFTNQISYDIAYI